MSTQLRSDPDPGSDDLVGRAGRWVFAKVWLGCLLSGLYAFTRHIGWPEAVVIMFAVFGAIFLAVASVWLPFWTRGHLTGIALLDVAARIVVWLGLIVAVVCLLVGSPAVGAVAGALLLTTAWRTFGPAQPSSPRSSRD
ncbi:hypothetical protein [Cryptosporangium arvum]|uniref:hypothetical protein n=1 Tax=Cryptosporangium arvum TaxID=80871 RepID=UPI0004B7425F|nr:hypothetical protein [Cryptosporangium arvum]